MNFNPPPPAYVPDDNDKNKNPTPSAGYSTNTANYGFQPNNDTWATGNGDTEAFGAAVGFENDQVRGRFVKKVTGILGIQLLITFGMTLGASSACQEIGPTGMNACMGKGLYAMPLVFTSMAGSMILQHGVIS